MSKNTTHLNCFFCRTSVTTNAGVGAVLCGNCTQRLSGSPTAIGRSPKREVDALDIIKAPRVKKQVDSTPKASTGFGRGWHLKKEFVAPDGQTYSFGKLVTSDNS